ncbi:MAG: class I SAM-dependent methyltransferase, partial [Desulfuromusa sp.]|nr:class I SAM-dependent methyltransferase [Desulfuromusa sp.]
PPYLILPLDFIDELSMIVPSMNISEYNFQRCKLCGEMAAKPVYDLSDCIIYCCQNCDFHYINQLDSNSENPNNTAHLDQSSRNYIESRLDENSNLHLKRLKFIQQHINLSDCKALDIGAGLGQFQRLLDAQGAETKGIEPSFIRRKYALEKFGVKLYNKLVDNDYWQAGYPQYFDLITLWDVIEHVDFPKETLESAIKLLKPGGMLFLDTPSRQVLSYRLSQQFYRLVPGKMSLFLPSFYSTAPYGHKQIFTQQQLAKLFRSFNLEKVFSAQSYTNRLFSNNKIILAGRKTELA